MRTTIDLPDSVYRRSQRAAQNRGVTVEEFIVRTFESALPAEPEASAASTGVNLPLIPSKRPGTLNLDEFDFDDLLA